MSTESEMVVQVEVKSSEIGVSVESETGMVMKMEAVRDGSEIANSQRWW